MHCTLKSVEIVVPKYFAQKNSTDFKEKHAFLASLQVRYIIIEVLNKKRRCSIFFEISCAMIT